MASCRFEKSGKRKGWRVFLTTANRKRRSIWLGDVPESEARRITTKIGDLVAVQRIGSRLDEDLLKWVDGLRSRLRETLASYGLCDPLDSKYKEDACRLLGPFLDAYLDSRTDIKPNTKNNYEQVIAQAKKYFGERKVLTAITPADCQKWLRKMRREYSDSTVNKYGKRFKTMLKAAIDDKLIYENPMRDIPLGDEVNRDRDFTVNLQLAAEVLDAMPDNEWKLLFALARWGGLRIPSESSALKWTDVDWSKGRLRIDSPKTGIRFCPLFPEIREFLTVHWEQAPDRAVHVLRMLRDKGDKNLRTQFNRHLERASIQPWPKTFVNLRGSRRTELQESYPDHVLNAWLGQSTQVANRHYLRVTDEHWERASQPSGVTLVVTFRTLVVTMVVTARVLSLRSEVLKRKRKRMK